MINWIFDKNNFPMVVYYEIKISFIEKIERNMKINFPLYFKTL